MFSGSILDQALADLRSKRDKLNAAIAALEQVTGVISVQFGAGGGGGMASGGLAGQ